MIEPVPAMDIIGGKVVRLTQGDYSTKKEYATDATAQAKEFENQGFKSLHIVDLDGAKTGKVANLAVLEAIARQTKLNIDFGGGIKTEADLCSVFSAGAKQATIGSVAVKEPRLVQCWMDCFGSDRLIICADVRDGQIMISGWTKQSGMHIDDFVKAYVERGIRRILCTDISRDGMLSGPNVPLYSRLKKAFPQCRFYASGGVGSMEDIEELNSAGVDFVIFGKAIYEHRIDAESVALKYLRHDAD